MLGTLISISPPILPPWRSIPGIPIFGAFTSNPASNLGPWISNPPPILGP